MSTWRDIAHPVAALLLWVGLIWVTMIAVRSCAI